MDPRPDRPPAPETDPPPTPPPIEVRVADPGEIAAGLPHLLGFRPSESVVLISLTGPGARRLGLVVRGDLPSAGHAPDVAAVLTHSVCSDRPSAVVLAVVSEAPDEAEPVDVPHRALVGEFVRALADRGVPVRDAVLVRDGRWWSYDCPHPCCAPEAGTPLPAGVTELEVAAVAAGTVVERDRDTLVARIARPSGLVDREAMAAACARVAVECSARILATGRDVVAEESYAAVLAAVARCRPGGATGGRLTDAEVARVVWGLRDVDVRDRALGLALGADAPAVEQLWTECTRRAPTPLDAAPATLLAVSAWLRGDGAMANVALTRALTGEPGYGLAGLLARALESCVSPSDLRAILQEATPLARDPRVGG